MAATSIDTDSVVAASGTLELDDGLSVRRLGYGAMRLTGQGIWGPPDDEDNAVAVLRRAVELGVNLVDTADSYGPEVSEQLIRRALHPYDGIVVATKAGFLRPGPGQWVTCGKPEYLRQQCELSLRRLGVERIDLFQLHRIDSKVPAEDQFGTLRELQQEGKVRLVGLSEVSVEQVEHARSIVDIATVQNRYNVLDRGADDVLRYCTEQRIGFMPWYPVAAGRLAEPGGAVALAAERLGATPAQVSLAWLLQRSSMMLPIPGTASLEHLEQNCQAATLRLDRDLVDLLDDAA
ncbi:MAG: NADP-dependent oxidoreductase domain protein [Pseudonocardia sp.]|nr:NADP-dependent oxidoreductase domain protein [Pseudonocardia sp.]